MTRLRILHVARNFPNAVLPRQGLWTERLIRSTLTDCGAEVIAPVPYWPPVPGPERVRRYRRIPRRDELNGAAVHYPRFLAGPGLALHSYEAEPLYAAIRSTATRLHRQRPFDLIHAHFIYPDGWAATRLGNLLGVPVIITEQCSWKPWLERYPRVRRRAMEAARGSTFILPVSYALRSSIAEFVGSSSKLRVVPNIVDDEIFVPGDGQHDPRRLLFVGLIRRVKGLDVLVRAVRLLLDQGRDVTLAVVGETVYASYQRDLMDVQRLVHSLRLQEAVHFVGGRSPLAVAAEIRASNVLVLPSRRETFGAVLVESLACGTPVVATRCGGPEDIVTENVGTLVEPESPTALAAGIMRVLDRRASYDARELREYAVKRFGMAAVGRALVAVYRQALARTAVPDDAVSTGPVR